MSGTLFLFDVPEMTIRVEDDHQASIVVKVIEKEWTVGIWPFRKKRRTYTEYTYEARDLYMIRKLTRLG